MILLDTNVVSEVMRPMPQARVLDWLSDQNAADLALSVISVAEIRYGLARLPEGRRRDDLSRRFETFLAQGFAENIHPVDQDIATRFGEIRARRDAAGRPMTAFDGLIAATAEALGATLATRNTGDFTDCGLTLFDPWG